MISKLVTVAAGAALIYYLITEYLIPEFYEHRDYLWMAFAAYLLLGIYYVTLPERKSSFW